MDERCSSYVDSVARDDEWTAAPGGARISALERRAKRAAWIERRDNDRRDFQKNGERPALHHVSLANVHDQSNRVPRRFAPVYPIGKRWRRFLWQIINIRARDENKFYGIYFAYNFWNIFKFPNINRILKWITCSKKKWWVKISCVVKKEREKY